MLAQAKDKLFATQIALIAFMSGARTSLRSQRGQASAEYLGIIIVAAILVIALITAASQWGESVVGWIAERLESINSAG